MRSFIGLDLSAQEKLALDDWRTQSMPDYGVAPVKSRNHSKQAQGPATPQCVPVANFHMTLCFLGHITEIQHEALLDALDTINLPPFSLTLDGFGAWSGPKIQFAAPLTIPEPLSLLASACRKAAREAHIQVENREYKPHVTVLRKANNSTPLPLIAPKVACTFNAFHLFESVSGKSGVQYPIRQSWSLDAGSSIRERLRQGIL